ncbi:MAG TPA: toll/interleukin-1 receptor domain-containing protein [Flavobacterium sp.]|uniref:toll/interleukin-1 receptor domain-containing protein n=1 Tax=Flavobacterium sp. TaxID=239 RepID=UPI002B4ABA5D|nr:toll/interleukin-1 receptor domain-containing protein [Flavobacterium sp.]HLO72792.1 toll/interleukin-1 receptor domain-containing protein [Flavobacterium sp.]
MIGINRALTLNEFKANLNLNLNVKCVFISHQKADTEYCKKIADYLINAGIDVYFDEYDKDLKFYRQTNNPTGVVDSIKKGIKMSSHMLCVISKDTLYSKWVPWEIGYGNDKTIQGAITIQGITSSELPDYLKTVQVVRGIKSFNSLITQITGQSEYILENQRKIKTYSSFYHPLATILENNL